MNIGLRPYTSPSLVSVTEPNTMPAKNREPKNPILISASQYKSN